MTVVCQCVAIKKCPIWLQCINWIRIWKGYYDMCSRHYKHGCVLSVIYSLLVDSMQKEINKIKESAGMRIMIWITIHSFVFVAQL